MALVCGDYIVMQNAINYRLLYAYYYMTIIDRSMLPCHFDYLMRLSRQLSDMIELVFRRDYHDNFVVFTRLHYY